MKNKFGVNLLFNIVVNCFIFSLLMLAWQQVALIFDVDSAGQMTNWRVLAEIIWHYFSTLVVASVFIYPILYWIGVKLCLKTNDLLSR